MDMLETETLTLPADIKMKIKCPQMFAKAALTSVF